MQYYRLSPWPARDFTALEAVYLPDRSDGLCLLADGVDPPDGAQPLTEAQYQTRKAAALAIIANRPPPPEEPERARLRAILGKVDDDITDPELREIVITGFRRLQARSAFD